MANLLEKASIILTPTAYSDGKIHSAKPIVSTNPSIGDFDFARASVATRVNENGLIEEVASGLPRIDYTDGSGSWLLEPASTNLITQSEDFSNVAWGKIRATVTSNSVISPDGTLNATFLSEDSSNNSHIIIDNSTLSGTYTHSIFAKKGTRVNIGLFCDSSSSVAKFDLDNGVILDSSVFDAEIKEYHNGWYRCMITTTQTTPVRIAILDNSANLSYQGDGTSGLYIWGAQVEANSYATSLINTVGTTQTRSADTASGSGNSTVINSTEGVLYFECSALANDVGSTRVLSISDGTGSNTLYSGYNSASNIIQAQIVVGGVAQTSMLHTVTDRTDFIKVAILYQNNNHKMFVNGVEVATDILGSVPSANTFNTLNFNLGQGSFAFYGKTKSVQVYTTALTDAELTTLTTI